MNFPWYAIHKETKYIIAGFVDFTDAETFCKAFAHDMYVVRDAATVTILHA